MPPAQAEMALQSVALVQLPRWTFEGSVQWWSVWYPGAEPGGGSYIAQRMLASKSEKDALAGTLFRSPDDSTVTA